MKRTPFFAFLVATVLMLSFVSVALPQAKDNEPNLAGRVDNRAHPMKEQKQVMHEKAVEAMLNGKAHGKTHVVAKGQYVELAREGEGPVWTVLGEFSDFFLVSGVKLKVGQEDLLFF